MLLYYSMSLSRSSTYSYRKCIHKLNICRHFTSSNFYILLFRSSIVQICIDLRNRKIDKIKGKGLNSQYVITILHFVQILIIKMSKKPSDWPIRPTLNINMGSHIVLSTLMISEVKNLYWIEKKVGIYLFVRKNPQ